MNEKFTTEHHIRGVECTQGTPAVFKRVRSVEVCRFRNSMSEMLFVLRYEQERLLLSARYGCSE